MLIDSDTAIADKFGNLTHTGDAIVNTGCYCDRPTCLVRVFQISINGTRTYNSGLTWMDDEKTLPGAEKSDMTDTTDNSLITDFTQVVSCAVGRDRAERRREKIRRELSQQYFGDEQQSSASLLSRFRKILGQA